MFFDMTKPILLHILIYWIVIQPKKPSDKRQQAIWKLECELGITSDPDCPVDGSWSPWSFWSSCQGNCDDTGQRRRTRQCNNPPPSKEGLACTGLNQEIQTCYITNCTVQDYKNLVEDDLARTQAFHQLETVPAIMERCLQTECTYEAIENALSADNTWQLNPEALWNSLQCVKHNLGCPVVGEWGPWGMWSTCGARCGLGLRWRLRRCDTPPPSDSHLICKGTPIQADPCEGTECAIERRGTNGFWSDWAKWSSCSENCGPGVRRRKRICLETQTLQASGTWRTHCRGQHDQLEVCENKFCTLDGGWSGWSQWGPCSTTCGLGRRSRSRSCTRPIRTERGKRCPGSLTEFGSCYLIPCEVHSHTVAVFNGESCLNYNFENRRSTFFHYYIRFMPLSPYGILVRRGILHNPLVRLSLQKWHICLEATGLAGSSCGLPPLCSHSVIEPAVWHTALVTVTSEGALLRLDDSPVVIKSSFSCDPELPRENVNIYVGEKFHGEIQQIALNFMPLNIFVQKDRANKTTYFPSSASNIAYEKANLEEAFLTLDNLQYLRLPCFTTLDDWKIELTLMPRTESGCILFLTDESNNWLHVSLQNMRIKLKWVLGLFRSESISSIDCWPGQWLTVTLFKQKETKMIEASINSGERFHIVLEERSGGKVRNFYKYKSLKKIIRKQVNITTCPLTICTDEYFVGGVPINIKNKILEKFTPFTGVIASINVNNILLDLHGYSVESYMDTKVQLSSRTASISGSFHETTWGDSNRLNLTCFHTKTNLSSNTAHWMYLDTSINFLKNKKSLQSVDDGRVLRLVAKTNNDLRGFYTCRSHTNRRTVNVVTYAVLGRIKNKFMGPDLTTAFAWFTTLSLVIASLAWLFIECIHDLRTGYGFFRDAHITPEEEAEAVCKYIDQNMHLVGSKSVVKMAKGRAWKRAHRVSSPSNFAAQEPQGMDQDSRRQHEESTPSEPDELPALPEIRTSSELSHNIYRCELDYISSPKHGSLTSPRGKITSSSSFETRSPRVLCSRLLLKKRVVSPRGSPARNVQSTPRNKRSLWTIKSSSYVYHSRVQKIIEKFQQLKKEDP